MIVCAGEIEQFDFAKAIGIGFTSAAISTTQICLENRPEFLLFVGTAGSYGNLEIFELFFSEKAANLEIGVLIEKSYSPIESFVNSKPPPNVSRETFPWFDVNSSNYITSDKNISNSFMQRGFDAENMEFYGFLKAAKRFNVPAFGLFAVTNFCDENAHEAFLLNHKNAKELLIKAVKKYFGDFI